MSKRSFPLGSYGALVLALGLLMAGCKSSGTSKPWWDIWKKDKPSGVGAEVEQLPPPPPAEIPGATAGEIVLPEISPAAETSGIPQVAPVREPPAGVVAGLKPVYFAYDSAELDGTARGVLEQDAAWFLQRPDTQIQVEGHCDERGTREYNFALGERRALAVREFLAGKGVPSDRLTVISYGEERPIAPGHGEEAWAQNRRVQFLGYR